MSFGGEVPLQLVVDHPADDELLARLGLDLHPDLDREVTHLRNTLRLQRLEDDGGELGVLHELLADLP